MIMALIDLHVGARRHVTRHTSRAGRTFVMRSSIERFRSVTLRAQRVALDLQLSRVRIVAIGASHTFRCHLALQERAHLEHFVANLTVGEVQYLVGQGESPSIEHSFV